MLSMLFKMHIINLGNDILMYDKKGAWGKMLEPLYCMFSGVQAGNAVMHCQRCQNTEANVRFIKQVKYLLMLCFDAFCYVQTNNCQKSNRA